MTKSTAVLTRTDEYRRHRPVDMGCRVRVRPSGRVAAVRVIQLAALFAVLAFVYQYGGIAL